MPCPVIIPNIAPARGITAENPNAIASSLSVSGAFEKTLANGGKYIDANIIAAEKITARISFGLFLKLTVLIFENLGHKVNNEQLHSQLN